MHVYSAHQSTHKEFSAETHCVFYWTLVASISKNKHCSLHHEDSYVLQVSKNGPQENFEVCLTISVFTQACVQPFTLILFSVVVCIRPSLYVSRKQKLCCFHHFYYIKTFLKQASDTNLHPSNVGDSTTYKIPPTHEKKIPSEKKKIP